MANETVITIVGNLTADPELRWTQNGLAVANLTIASTPRTFDRQRNEMVDGESLFLRCSVWREFAEHVAGSLAKGMRVVAQGRLSQKSYQDREGVQRTSYELEIDEIGPSLRWATAQVTRSSGNGNQQGNREKFRNQQQGGGMRPGTSPDQPWQPNQGHPQDGQVSGQQSNDVWSTPGGGYDDETPF